MKILAKFTALILSAMCLFGVVACGGGKKDDVSITQLVAPTYSSVTVGSTVTVIPCYAETSEGDSILCTTQVISPNGSTISGNTFTADVVGSYSIIYTAQVDNVKKTKVAILVVTASGSQDGGNQGGGGNNNPTTPNAVLGSLKVIEGSEDYFSVSGNTVTVKRTCATDDWKTIGWDLTGWTMANGQNITITVTNNTTGILDVKYKALVDGGEQYGHPDLSIAANGSQTYSGKTYHEATNPTSVTRVELCIGSSATGTFTVEASLSGTGGSAEGNAMLGTPSDNGGGQYLSVSGTASAISVSLLQACAESNYASVVIPVTNYNASKAANLTVNVSSYSGVTKLKYKVDTNTGEGWGYPDFELSGTNPSQSWNTLTYSDATQNATNVTQVEIFIIGNSGGTINFSVTLG